MYKSPIELLTTDIKYQIEKQQDKEIYRAVLQYIPNVDKKELIKALRYDREQYEKGYADGKRDAEDSIVRCKDCKHCIRISRVFGDVRCGKLYTDYIKEDDFCSYGEREDNG